MIIGIVGLGLIGGSFAQIIKNNNNNTVYASEINRSSYLAAKMTGACDSELNAKTLPLCDFVLICTYPSSIVNYVIENSNLFKKDAIIVDCCGVKKKICNKLYSISKDKGFHYIGGHPMAGTQQWGFSHSRASLFANASMILTPDENTNIATLEKAKLFFKECGFGSVIFCTPDEHDKMIAFTSQLPHIISNAYVKSPSAIKHKGFSAGSYKDLSRVAKLNSPLWTELFNDNREYLIDELDIFIENITQYRDALRTNDLAKLTSLLDEGSQMKSQAK